jgi:glycine oxidase
MAPSADILIIGGGVIGLTTAYFLAREGAQVEIVDKGDFGQEASWAGAGILPPGNPTLARTPFDKLRAHSAALFPSLSAELRERTGIDNGYLRCGGLELAGREGEAAANEWRSEAIAFQELDEQQLRQREPALAPGLAPAFYLPDMAQLRNPRHLRAIVAGCQHLGVRLRPGCPAHDFEKQGSRIIGVRSEQGALRAGRYLLSAGAWSEGLLEPLGIRAGIHPVRGQIALLHSGRPLFGHLLLWGAHYLVPRADGRILVGSTEEDAGFDKRTTAGAIAELLALGCKLVPALADAAVERCWAGLRPGSPDGLPYLGAVPGSDNLFIAAGHFRAGIQLSPATGLVLKELLLGQPLTVPLDAFRLDRTTPAKQMSSFTP